MTQIGKMKMKNSYFQVLISDVGNITLCLVEIFQAGGHAPNVHVLTTYRVVII